MPPLSTPTIATGTTIADTPSTTNSTHRSPPQTPHSSNRVKSTVSGSKENLSDVQSSVDKNCIEKHPSKHPSIVTTNGKHSQSSTKLTSQMIAINSGSASGQNPLPSCGTRVPKKKDKHARLRKRLKCCSHDQLMEQIIQLVRSSAVPEKVINDITPRVDMDHFLSKCKSLKDSIIAQLPDDALNSTQTLDGITYRKCKKAVTDYKNTVISMGKQLVDAALWSDVVLFCVAAARVTSETPVWVEAAHNKTRGIIRSKLEQFALKAATNMMKGKDAVDMNMDEHINLIKDCRDVFPDVAAKLQGNDGMVVDGVLDRPRDFEGPMISATQLRIDI